MSVIQHSTRLSTRRRATWRAATRLSSSQAGGPTMHRRIRRRGLSLVEVLIALAITATLLTAVSAAYVASAQAVEVNDQFFRASQAARVSVTRISGELRKCRSGTLYGSDTLELITSAGEKHTYHHDPVTKRLLLTLDLPVPRTHKLASNVEKAEFFSNGKSVTVNIVVRVGKNAVALNGSAIPRRAIEY